MFVLKKKKIKKKKEKKKKEKEKERKRVIAYVKQSYINYTCIESIKYLNFSIG